MYLSICPFVQVVKFEPHYTKTFLVWRYVFPISRLVLSTMVIGSKSWPYEKNDSFAYFNMLICFIWLQVVNNIKVTHQGDGHFKVKVKISTSISILCHLFW